MASMILLLRWFGLKLALVVSLTEKYSIIWEPKNKPKRVYLSKNGSSFEVMSCKYRVSRQVELNESGGTATPVFSKGSLARQNEIFLFVFFFRLLLHRLVDAFQGAFHGWVTCFSRGTWRVSHDGGWCAAGGIAHARHYADLSRLNEAMIHRWWKLLPSVTPLLSWLERRTGIARSRVEALLNYRLLYVIDHFTAACLVAWPLNESEAGGDLVLIETSLLFFC